MVGDRTSPDDGECRHEVEQNVTLPYVPTSVTEARKLLQSDLAALGVGETRLDDAVLVLSELVSNALRHATPLTTPEGDSVGVSWRIELDPETASGGWVEISICDGGSSTMPRVARPSVSGLGGRGLGIVQNLAGRWGTQMEADTTTVWAVLEISADDLAPNTSGGAVETPEAVEAADAPEPPGMAEARAGAPDTARESAAPVGVPLGAGGKTPVERALL